LTADVYSAALRVQGFEPVRPSDDEINEWAEPAIRSVKAGRIDAGHYYARGAVAALERRGVAAIVLACTELPIAHSESRSEKGTPVISSTHSLARACLDWIDEYEKLHMNLPLDGPALQPSLAATA
jgi:aspartate racemase